MPSTTEGGAAVDTKWIQYPGVHTPYRLSQDKDPTNRVVESYFGFYGTYVREYMKTSRLRRETFKGVSKICNERVFSLSYIDVVKVRVEKS